MKTAEKEKYILWNIGANVDVEHKDGFLGKDIKLTSSDLPVLRSSNVLLQQNLCNLEIVS